MSSHDMFGWDLLFRVVENDIQRKEDVLVVLIHWYLIKSGFRCIGIGDDRTLDASDEPTELLPQGWSLLEKTAIRYVHNDQLYVLHGIFTDGTALFNLLKINGLSVSNVFFAVNETISATHGSINQLFPDVNGILNSIKKSLVEPVFAGASKEVQTQTPQASRPRQDLSEPSRALPDLGVPLGMNPLGGANLLRDINNAGRRDLDPFGLGGPLGNNPYDPFHPGFGGPRGGSHPGLGVPGGLGRAGMPPGARFDPFGPPDPDGARPVRRPHPDFDHFQPPNFGDDMFS